MELTRAQIPDDLMEFFEPVGLCGECYVCRMVAVFREVWRVLRDDGTLWLNLGDSYATGAGAGRSMGGDSFGKQNMVIDAGSYPACQPNRGPIPGLKPKDLCGIPWRVAFALQADGWYLRSDIIWAKLNPMPESVTDRPTKAHEYVFLMSKAARYWYDADAVCEASDGRTWHDVTGPPRMDVPGQTKQDGHGRRYVGFNARYFTAPPPTTRNRRTVWTIATQPYPDAHFATYPEKLVEPCLLAGCPAGGTVLDPFTGRGTTGAVACRLGRNFVGVELNPEYAAMAERRIAPHRDQMQIEVKP